MKKKVIIISLVLILIFGIYFTGTGFTVRSDVFLSDFTVSEDDNKITLTVGVSSSIGYIRKVKNVSDDEERIDLKFYSAFGGINGSVGSKNCFEIDLSEENKEIRFFYGDSFKSVLSKNEVTCKWKRAE